jgi:hypothetical protein
VSSEELAEWIIDNGNYLLTIKENSLKINLYYLNDEFYEIHFDTEKNSIINSVKVSRDAIKRFIDEIDLTKFK